MTDLNDLFARLVVEGLSEDKKWLPTQFLYDEEGSKLFDKITELDAYYLTRTELAIMQDHVADMAQALGPRCRLVEFGAGSGLKTRRLLAAMDDVAAYIPIDISDEHLASSVKKLRQDLPGLRVCPATGDFTKPLKLPDIGVPFARTAVYFPGSTIGNFERGHAAQLMRGWAELVGQGGNLLVGVDLLKDRARLELAYDDPEGVTAAFSKNILAHANRALGTDFDLDGFDHHAEFNEDEERIDIYLVSNRAQSLTFRGKRFDFEKGERVHTEYSHKYSLEGFAALAEQGNFSVEQVWTDPGQDFSVQLLTAT